MEKEVKTVLKKTVKIAGITCLALSGAALIASGAALKALTEGAKYVKNSVRKIIDEKPGEETADAAEAEVAAAPVESEAEAAVEETVAAE